MMSAGAAVLATPAGTSRETLPDVAELVPQGFVVEEHRGQEEECAPWPGEDGLLGPGWAKNRYQSLMARECARRALIRLGQPPAAIPRTPNGAPSWPDGIIGSLTHCEGYRAAIVGRTVHGRSAGIDAEVHRPLPHGVLDLIAGVPEKQLLGRLQDGAPGVHWGTVLFCVKEAVYKAWFPLTRTWLPMTQASAWLGPDGTFRVSIRLRENQPGDLTLLSWKGRWTIRDGIVLAVAVRAPLA
ncbi:MULTISPECIES: 4'-phosphopantetheinyl transferase family protein [Micrococcaceae]|jgi:4'-phosphopantetheinyl transferase EntD|uniref:4'-phosphopantetheinyl transferase family protein n=1 Tax=Micrococcaceae TaxID=1268 RepID=UPI00166FDAA4|nr:4'-phosphopantetheinyl transferase superfamily protein [Arthrobacter sp. AFG7.2]MDV2979891.1 4'-phosphopantetheinyl transferase superfamily protein [Actinomycetes bacterium ARC8]